MAGPRLPRSFLPLAPRYWPQKRTVVVVVQLVQDHPELLDGGDDDVGDEAGAVGVEETIERSADRVVADRRRFLLRQTEALWGEAADRLLLSVDRLPLHEDGPDQDTERLPVGDAHSPVRSRHETIQSDIELEAVKEVVDQRKGPLALCRE